MRREYGLDALRVFAFVMLILYHSGMGYVPWGWHVKNNELSEAFIAPMQFLNRWRLPLLFFISGCGVAFSLRRRTLVEFRSERLRRLGLPILVAIFVIVPPQIYFERLAQGATFSYAEFYPSVFQFVPYPKGSTYSSMRWRRSRSTTACDALGRCSQIGFRSARGGSTWPRFRTCSLA